MVDAEHTSTVEVRRGFWTEFPDGGGVYKLTPELLFGAGPNGEDVQRETFYMVDRGGKTYVHTAGFIDVRESEKTIKTVIDTDEFKPEIYYAGEANLNKNPSYIWDGKDSSSKGLGEFSLKLKVPPAK